MSLLIKFTQANARALELEGIAQHNPTPHNKRRAENARRKLLRLLDKLSDAGVFIAEDWTKWPERTSK